MTRLFGRRRNFRFVMSGVLLGASMLVAVVVNQLGTPDASRAMSPGPYSAAQAAPAEFPTDFAGAFAAGVAFMRQGDAHAAARSFEAARSANPHAPEAYANLGFAYFELGQHAAARTAFERAVEVQPMYASSYFGLAEVYEAEGDLEGAIGAMQTYVHLTPEDDPFRRRAMAAVWEWRRPPVGQDQTQAAVPALGLAKEGSVTGQPLFDAPLETMEGGPASLAGYRDRYVVLNIWAAWCGPCRMELPSLDRLAGLLDSSRIAVVGVSIDRQRAFTREFLDQLGVAFPNYWDGARKLSGDLLDARTLPLTLIIAPGGEILFRYVGARDWSEPGLVAAIAGLADESAAVEDRLASLRERMQ